MVTERIKRCLEPGLSILVGSVSAEGIPSCCRGIALTSDDDLTSATVYVPLVTSQETISNIAATGRMAVLATHPIDHCSTQLKGTTLNVRLAKDDEAGLVKSGLDRFADILNVVGVPKRVMRAVVCWPAFAVDLRVDEIFDQTPGPKAGSRLR
jgi:hypothetical protein